MASYCAYEDVAAAIGPNVLMDLADDDRTGVEANAQTNVESAIAAASAQIDGIFAGGRSSVPSPAPGYVTAAAVDITVYLLYRRRDPAAIPEDVSADRETAIRDLKEVAKSGSAVPVSSTPSSGVSFGSVETDPAASDGKGIVVL